VTSPATRRAIIADMVRHAAALLAAACIAAPAAAQVQRAFPQNALRGALVLGVAPGILLNGAAASLAPGARIRDAANMAVVPSAVAGGPYLVHYTVDTSGLVKDVWILRPDEAAVNPWPRTRAEAESWRFDPVGQFWSKP
jgi:hypothetical protein